MKGLEIDGIEVYDPDHIVVCSLCGARVQAGAPSEVCCPPIYDKPAPPWVYEFHAEHEAWPKHWR